MVFRKFRVVLGGLALRASGLCGVSVGMESFRAFLLRFLCGFGVLG